MGFLRIKLCINIYIYSCYEILGQRTKKIKPAPEFTEQVRVLFGEKSIKNNFYLPYFKLICTGILAPGITFFSVRSYNGKYIENRIDFSLKHSWYTQSYERIEGKGKSCLKYMGHIHISLVWYMKHIFCLFHIFVRRCWQKWILFSISVYRTSKFIKFVFFFSV